MNFKQITQPFLNFIGIHKIYLMDLIPTWKCNARCITCNAWNLPKEMLSKYQAANIIDYFKDLRFMTIEGGEVSLWPELTWFVSIMISKYPKLAILIITNGLDYDYWQSAQCFWKLNLGNDFHRIRFAISIMGIGLVHDIARGLQGSYEKNIETVKMLIRNGSKVKLHYVPFKFNEDEYFKVAELGEKVGCQITHVCYPSFSTKFHTAKNLSPVDIEKLKKMYEHYKSQLSCWSESAIDYFLDHVNKKKLMPCIAGVNFVNIVSDGTIKPCAMMDGYQMGKVNDDGIVWTCGVEKHIKKDIPKICQYQNGDVCCDYMPIMSIKMHPVKFLGWKLRRMLCLWG